MKRLFAWAALLSEDYNADSESNERHFAPEADANLVTSVIADPGANDMHMPVLDLDVPHRLVPSSTPGHSHLYIDVPMTWERYKVLLYCLADLGILEQGYVNASIERGYTCVRKPGVTKPAFTDLDFTKKGWGFTDDIPRDSSWDDIDPLGKIQ